MESAGAVDQVGAVDTDDSPGLKRVGQNPLGSFIAPSTERRNEDDIVGDVEVEIA